MAKFEDVTEAKREVDELRERLARLDVELLDAIDKRAQAARRLGELRRDQAPLLPLTDHESLRAIVSRSTGAMPEDALRAIFGEIHAACLALELPVKIAFVGLEGGPCHAAARGRFGRNASLSPAGSTPAALDEVSRKHAEFAVVPFETASEGPVQATIQALSAGDLRVVEVLERDRVRYAVVCARPSGRTGNDVTAVVFGAQDSPGALLDVLRVFAERGINLTNVHSHPVEGEPWVYLFYVEMAGHFTDRPLVGAFEELKRLTRFFKLLGSYPSP
jgi:chorismate mutase